MPGGDDDDYYYELDDHDDGGEDADADADVLSEAGDKMVDVATALLASRPANARVTFALSFHLRRRRNYLSLGRLLDGAVASGKVHAVELTLTSRSSPWVLGSEEDDNRGCARRLGYGRRFRVLLDACPAAFGALTQLTVEKVKLRKADLRDILGTCTRLEKLSLYYCNPGPGGGCGRCATRGSRTSGSPCAASLASASSGYPDWSASLSRAGSRRPTSCCPWVPSPASRRSPCPTNTAAAVSDLRLNFRGNNVRRKEYFFLSFLTTYIASFCN